MTGLLETLRSEAVLRLGWALLHSLWEIALLAAALAAVLTMLRRRSANLRYVTACAGMAAMFALPVVTYCLVTQPPGTEVAAVSALPDNAAEIPLSPAIPEAPLPGVGAAVTAPEAEEAAPPVLAPASVAPAAPTTWEAPGPGRPVPESRNATTPLPGRISRVLSPWIPWVVTAWLTGVFSLSVWHLGGWIATQRLKHWGTSSGAEQLTRQLAGLIGRMRVSRPVQMLQSAMVDAPVLIGWLRPVILVPAAMLSGMPPRQIEAILAHELAHVRRYDYLVNLFQTLVETLLFYHPAVWWLSRRVRIEREHCCDDAAVAVCGSRVDYAAALMAVEQGRRRPRLAVAAGGPGRGGTALSRVRRVLNVSGREPIRPQISLVGVFLVVALVGLLAGYIATAGEHPQKPDQDVAGETASEGAAEKEAAEEEEEQDAQPADLKLEARVVGIDGEPLKHSSITFWEAVDPETLKKSDRDEGPPGFDDVPHTWHDRATGKIWRPIHHFGAGDRATEEGLAPGDYRVTAYAGRGGPTMLAVSEPVHLDGSQKHTVVTLRIQDGPSLRIELVDAQTGKPLEYPGIRLVRSDGLPVVPWSSTWSIHPTGNGHKFEHLAPGEYTLEAFKRAYRYGDRQYAAEQGPMKIRLAANQDRKLTVKLKVVGPSEDEARRRWPWAVTGTVTDGQGRPLPGVQIRASCGWGTLMPTGETLSDPQGNYTLRFGPGMRVRRDDGTWGAGIQAATIYAFKSGYTEKNLCRQGGLLMGDKLPEKGDPRYGDRDRVVLPDKPRRLDFVMVAAANLEGELVDEQGKPIADKGISVQGKQMLPSTSVLAQGKTDRQGRFRFEGIPANYGWWFSVGGQGRTQPITLPGPGTYRVKLQLAHYAQYNLDVFRITGVTDPEGNDLGDKLVGDDPSARPPVAEELQEQGRSYLRKMAAACRDWLGPPPAEVRNYEYRFRLGDGEPTTHRIGDASRAAGPIRQGITYFGTPHILASRPEKVIFRQVEVDREKILLSFLVQDSVKLAAGNGISGTWRGYFDTPLREGLLVLDKTTYRPVRTDVGNVQETFSQYMGLGDARFVPLAIRIQKGSTDWNWRFRVYQPGLWLLAESRTHDGEGRGGLLVTVDQVKVNGQAAVPMAEDGIPVEPKLPAEADEAAWGPAVDGVQVRLRAERRVWNAFEAPAFKANVRNRGAGSLSIRLWQGDCELEVDGRWYVYSPKYDSGFLVIPEATSLRTGQQSQDVPLLLDDWERKGGGGPLVLTPGGHTLRAAFVGTLGAITPGEGGKRVRVLSNPVEIEIVAGKPAPDAGKTLEGASANNDRITQLIEQLGDREYAKREAAQQELIQIGFPARTALRKALKHNDPEIAIRARRALAEIGMRPEELYRKHVANLVLPQRDDRYLPSQKWLKEHLAGAVPYLLEARIKYKNQFNRISAVADLLFEAWKAGLLSDRQKRDLLENTLLVSWEVREAYPPGYATEGIVSFRGVMVRTDDPSSALLGREGFLKATYRVELEGKEINRGETNGSDGKYLRFPGGLKPGKHSLKAVLEVSERAGQWRHTWTRSGQLRIDPKLEPQSIVAPGSEDFPQDKAVRFVEGPLKQYDWSSGGKKLIVTAPVIKIETQPGFDMDIVARLPIEVEIDGKVFGKPHYYGGFSCIDGHSPPGRQFTFYPSPEVPLRPGKFRWRMLLVPDLHWAWTEPAVDRLCNRRFVSPWYTAEITLQIADVETFRQERTWGEREKDFDAKLRHFRNALTWKSDHPEKVALEYRVAVMLRQFRDSSTDTLPPPEWPRRKEALAMFRGIVERYDHMSYYTNGGAGSWWEAQLVLPHAAMTAASLLEEQGGDKKDAARYRARALEMMNQTCRRRIREWATAPRPQDPMPGLGGLRERGKHQARVAEWERRKKAAVDGEVLSVSELRVVDGMVPSIDRSRGGRATPEVLARLRQIVETYRGTPIARIAQQRLEAAKGDPRVLLRQLNAGELSDDKIRQITDKVLAIQGDLQQPWDGAWGDWLETARAKGKVSDADFTRYAKQSNPTWKLLALQITREDGKLGVSFGITHFGGRVASVTTDHNLVIKHRLVRLRLGDVPLDAGNTGGEWSFVTTTQHGFGLFREKSEIEGLEKLEPGKYEAVAELVVTIYEAGHQDKILHRCERKIKDELELTELLFSSANEDRTWGPAVEGVQVRLRATQAKWKHGAVPRLVADLRNRGKRNLSVAQSQESCSVEVDGRRYHWTGPIDVKSSPFPPGRQYDNIPISLGGPWASDAEPLTLKPGKHVIRVTFVVSPVVYAGNKPLRALSNPVEIEVVDAETNKPTTETPDQWGPAVQGVQCRLDPERLAWKAVEKPRFKAYVRHQTETRLFLSNHPSFGAQLEVDGHWHRWNGPFEWSGPSHSSSKSRTKDGQPLAITLDENWKQVDNKQPLRLDPGRHVVRFAWGGHPERGPREGPDEQRNLVLTSNPVEITILPHRPEPKPDEVHPADKDATAALKQLGAILQADDQGRIRSVRLSRTAVTDAGLEHLKGLSGLKALYLDDTRITDAGLGHLAGLTGLETLSINYTRVGDAGLEHLNGLGGLGSLELLETEVTAAGLRKLKKTLPALQVTVDPMKLAGLGDLRGWRNSAELSDDYELLSIDLLGPEVKDAWLERLKDRQSLQDVCLFRAAITDAGLAHLQGLTELHTLYLSSTRITDAGLEYLKHMKKLKTLFLADTRISDAGLARLSGLTNLELLWLGGTQVTDAGLVHLKPLTSLKHLKLNDCQIAGAGLSHLRRLTKLATLELNETPIADAGLVHLKPLVNLELLYLSHTLVTDAGLEHLTGLKKLRMLEIEQTPVTEDGIKWLKQRLPKASFYHSKLP